MMESQMHYFFNEAMKREPLHFLDQRIVLPLRKNEVRALDSKSAEVLYNAIGYFRMLAEKGSPASFYSKFAFVHQLEEQSTLSPELLLCLLSDRYFYFSEYRDLGNLRGGQESLDPAPGIKELYNDTDGEVLKRASYSPKDLIEHALNTIAGRQAQYADDGSEEYQKDMRLEKAVCDSLCRCMDPAPKTIVGAAEILRLAKEKYHSADANESAKAGCEPFLDTMIKQMLIPYEVIVEKHRRAQQTIEHEWIPTNIHQHFYSEMQNNYQELQQAIQQRQDDLLVSEKLIKQLNDLTKRYTRAGLMDLPDEYQTLADQLIGVFEKYVCSLLHDLHKQEYLPILRYIDQSLTEKPYRDVIYRLLACCVQDDGLHPLSRLFFYSAFSENTKVILQGANGKRKPVRAIKRKTKPVAVYKMASMTGYRAALNLVLYHDLKAILGSYGSVCLLGREGRAFCEKKLYANAAIGRRIQPDQCFSEGKTGCPFVRTCEAWNDWGFALISGYGFLFHHKAEIGVTYEVPYDEIFVTREEQQMRKTGDVQEAPQPATNMKKYPIMKYTMDLARPVGKLEGLLRQHAQNCIPNRPRFLTPYPTGNIYGNTDPFALPYEELAFLLLQDAHLPAMRRIIRKIKKLVSEHPEYLEKYEGFLLNAIATSSGEINRFLADVVQEHGLYYQVPRYTSFQTSQRSYNIDATLHNILEYELRSQLYEQQQEKLMRILKKSLPENWLLYENII